MEADYQYVSKYFNFWQQLRNSPLHIVAIQWLSKKTVGLFGMAYHGATVGSCSLFFEAQSLTISGKSLEKPLQTFHCLYQTQ